MFKPRLLIAVLVASLVAMPAVSSAQLPDSLSDQHFIHNILKALMGPNWNVFVRGGATTDDRYLLQGAPNPLDGERSLQSGVGYNLGGGAGVDLFAHLGARLGYSFTSSQLNFRTDNGDGSKALNVDDVGRLKSNTIALEAMRYMLPARAMFTPYGTIGIQTTWWSLDSNSPLITSSGAGSQWSISPLFSFGVQVRPSDHWSGRLEATLSGGHNPFTGGTSFRSLAAGPMIDEPSSVNRTAFHLAGVYYIGSQKTPKAPPVVTHH